MSSLTTTINVNVDKNIKEEDNYTYTDIFKKYIIKNPIVLDFVDLKEDKTIHEKDIEKALVLL